MLKVRKVLVIDNEVLVADLCRNSLRKLGYEVVCAYSGEQAIKLSARKSFDLAIVNTLLEGITGIEAFEIIKQNNSFLAGILITDHANLDMIIGAMNGGFRRVLKKPLDIAELTRVVEETMKATELREENTRMSTLLPLYELGEKFMAAEKESDVYKELVDAVMSEVNVSAVSVLMFDEQDELLKLVASRGLDPDVIKDVKIKPGEKIAGRVFELRKPVILNRHDQQASPFMKLLKRKELAAAISFPIHSKDQVLGVLNVSQTRDDTEFSNADIEMLSVISRQAVMALENVKLISQKEKTSRIKALLEQYVSPEISAILMAGQNNLMDVGSVQELTVLFADIRKFTLLVQRLPPARLRLFLNCFFDIFTDIVFSCKGTLDKFMGDAALVIFGAPVELATPSISAVTAAGQIMVEFEKLRQSWARQDDVFNQVGLGIGISRGPMFLGNVGSSRRLDYTVIGTDVNIAQRLASETLSGQVLLTESVFAEIDDSFNIKPEKRRLLRGMDSEIAVYSLKCP